MKPRIVLAGGSGFLGTVLSKHLFAAGSDVVILTRTQPLRNGPARHVLWDGCSPGEWIRELEGAGAVINLAGRSVNCRYHARNRQEILDSRVIPTRLIGAAISRCKSPPAVWLNASTATIYKHAFHRAMDETTGEIGGTREARDEFSVDVACAWEAAFHETATPRTRKVALRTAMVLGLARNSVFPVLRRLVRFGLGGKMGSGHQYVSWIHEEDFCRAVQWLLDEIEIAGPVNLAAPNPIPNVEMMRMLRRIYRVPIGLPASRWMLEIGALFLRTETELIIKSRRVVPERLLRSGFSFRFPEMEAAARELEHRLRFENVRRA